MAKITTFNGTKEHKVVSHDQWLAARKSLLAKEKKFTKLRDQLNQQRRNLSWEKVEKEYVFDGPGGKQTLPELFDGILVIRISLVIRHAAAAQLLPWELVPLPSSPFRKAEASSLPR